MFAFFVVLILPLVQAVLLSDVGNAASQVGQQVLHQKSRLAGLLGHTHIEVGWPVDFKTQEKLIFCFK